MSTRQWRGRTLQVGDKVRLRPGTPGWAQHANLRGKVGEVVALVDDGTSLHRITVAFDGWRLPPGMYEEHFEKVAEVRPACTPLASPHDARGSALLQGEQPDPQGREDPTPDPGADDPDPLRGPHLGGQGGSNDEAAGDEEQAHDEV